MSTQHVMKVADDSDWPIAIRPCLVWYSKIIEYSLTIYWSVKQSQFIKLTPEPCTRNSEESNEIFDRVIKE